MFAEVGVDIARADHAHLDPALRHLGPQTVSPGLEGVFAGEELDISSGEKVASQDQPAAVSCPARYWQEPLDTGHDHDVSGAPADHVRDQMPVELHTAQIVDPHQTAVHTHLSLQ